MEVLDTSDEEQPESGVHIDVSRGKPDCVVILASRNLVVVETESRGKLHVHYSYALDYNYALDSLYESDILESVPVAPGEQSLHEHAVAAARALAASRAHGLSHKRKQRGSAPPAAVAVASWRRRVQ